MDDLRKLALSQLKRVLGMTDRTAVPLEQTVWNDGSENYARVIRLLLQGKSYETAKETLKQDIRFKEVVVEDTDKYVVEGMTECPKCKSRRVRTTEQQTRGCDESKTQFNLCVECKHQWKF